MRIRNLRFKSISPHDVIANMTQGKAKSVITAHAEMIYSASVNDSYLFPIQDANILTADGVGLIWGLRLLGRDVEKCSGSDIVNEMIQNNQDLPVYLWGSTSQNLGLAVEKMRREHCNIVGSAAGYNYRQTEVFADIKSAAPAVVLVGMGGSEKQLELVNEIRDQLGISAITVGGMIDLLAGVGARAPKCVQAIGAEWLWRMAISPKRIHKLPRLVGFVWLVLKERFGNEI